MPLPTVKELRQEYLLSKLPANEIQKTFLKNCSPEDVRQLFKVTIGQNTNLPPIQCRVRWVRFIIKQLETREVQLSGHENDDDEISEWYDALQHLTAVEPQTEPFYRLHVDDDNQNNIIKMFESESAFVSSGTTGLVTWEASIHLVKYFTATKHILDSVNWIIELGCGSGYLAISILRLKSYQSPEETLRKYIATEGSLIALSQCQENVNINLNVQDDQKLVKFLKFDWTDSADTNEFRQIVEESTRKYGSGLLVGADITFDPELIPHLLHSINIFLQIQYTNVCKNPGKVILSCDVRNEATIQHLKNQLVICERKCEQTGNWNNGLIFTIK